MRMARRIGFSAFAAFLLLAPTSSFGAGFALFEHGSRAVGLGGAFGATADDPTAIYFNPAGIAFLQGTQFALGTELITESDTFTGANPYPGQGYSVDMKKQIFALPELYLTGELTPDLHWGIGAYAPFGLGTWWPDEYAGKYISKRVTLQGVEREPDALVQGHRQPRPGRRRRLLLLEPLPHPLHRRDQPVHAAGCGGRPGAPGHRLQAAASAGTWASSASWTAASRSARPTGPT